MVQHSECRSQLQRSVTAQHSTHGNMYGTQNSMCGPLRQAQVESPGQQDPAHDSLLVGSYQTCLNLNSVFTSLESNPCLPLAIPGLVV